MHRLCAIAPLLLAACAAATTPTPAEPEPAAPVVEAAPAAQNGPAFGVEVYGEGPDVVLIPGLACGGHVWDATVDHLRDSHRVHVLTISGFAGRPALDGPLLPTVRDELVAYLEPLDRPVVIGHSLGGFMTYWLASTEPSLLAGAIAVDGVPALGWLMMDQPRNVVEDFARGARAQFDSLSQESFAVQTEQTLRGQIKRPEEVERVTEVSGRSDPAAVGQAVEELLLTDLRDQVANIEIPMLILGAGAGAPREIEYRTERYRGQVASIPKHELVMVPETLHFVMLDAPEVFLQHVDRFLEAVQ
ncbi:MAG: alpha/beta hydrolase [Myxococcota bacterium]